MNKKVCLMTRTSVLRRGPKVEINPLTWHLKIGLLIIYRFSLTVLIFSLTFYLFTQNHYDNHAKMTAKIEKNSGFKASDLSKVSLRQYQTKLEYLFYVIFHYSINGSWHLPPFGPQKPKLEANLKYLLLIFWILI